MNDHISRENLLDYLEGALPVQEQSLVRQHIGDCRDCRSRLALYWRIDARLSRVLPQIAENSTLDSARWIELEASLDALSQVNGHRTVAALADRHKEKERLLLFKRFSPMMMFTQALLIAGFSAFLAFVLFRPTQQGNEEEVTAVPDSTQESLTLEPTPVSLTPLEYPYQLGPITLTDDTTEAQLTAMPSTQLREPLISNWWTTPLWLSIDYAQFIESWDEANSRLGASVLTPLYVPPGYGLTTRVADSIGGDETFAYVNTSYNAIGDGRTLLLNQIRYADGHGDQYPLGGAPLYAVSLRGTEGVYIEAAGVGLIPPDLVFDEATGKWVRTIYDPSTPVTLPIWTFNMLMWEENDTVLRLMADNLTVDDLLRVAESLTTDDVPPPQVQDTCNPGPDQKMAFSLSQYYCLLYPASYPIAISSSRIRIAGSFDADGGPLPPFVAIAMFYASIEQTAETELGELLVENVEQVQRSEITVAGEHALQLDNVLNPDGTLERIVLIEHGGLTYRLRFQSADPADPEAYARMEALYTMVLDSFRFLDPATTGGATPTPISDGTVTATAWATFTPGGPTPTATPTVKATNTPDSIMPTATSTVGQVIVIARTLGDPVTYLSLSPDADAPIMAEVPPGTDLLVIGRWLGYDWLIVQWEDAPDDQAWVLASLVEIIGDITYVPAVTPMPTQNSDPDTEPEPTATPKPTQKPATPTPSPTVSAGP
jgi:hypothetical protein